MSRVLQSIRAVLGSKWFYYTILGFFVFEALWIAFTAVYPQAFDEDFHFGLIKIYSHYWLPWLSSQPPGADAFGAMTRDPSYLYHYLMSFPYRLIALFIHGQTGQVIALRIVNIGLFTTGLVLFRRVLRRVGTSAAATNVSLLVVALIPIAPQLAGQINYDNLLLPLVALTCLLVLKVYDQIKQTKLSLTTLGLLTTVCFLATMVKYEFAPIFLGVIIFLGLAMARTYRGKLGKTFTQAWKNWPKQSSKWVRLGVAALLVVSLALFVQRDVVNVIKYHTIAPDCRQVMSIQACKAYGVWNHDYLSHQLLLNGTTRLSSNPITYSFQWLYWLWYRLFFAINGPAHGFRNYPPLPLPSAGFVILAVGAVVVTIANWRRIFRDSGYQFLGLITVLYLAILLLEGYIKYRQTAVLELMNGRYLLPVLLPAAAIGIRAISLTLKRFPDYKTVLATILIIMMLDGGGVITFVSRSNSSWDWPNTTVVRVNNDARRTIEPIIFDGSKAYTTRHWFFN